MYASTASTMDEATPLAVRRSSRDSRWSRGLKIGAGVVCLGGLAAVATLANVGPAGGIGAALGAPFSMPFARDSVPTLAGDARVRGATPRLAQADNFTADADATAPTPAPSSGDLDALTKQVMDLNKQLSELADDNDMLEKTILDLEKTETDARVDFLRRGHGGATAHAAGSHENELIADVENRNKDLFYEIEKTRQKRHELVLREMELHEEISHLDVHMADADRSLNACNLALSESEGALDDLNSEHESTMSALSGQIGDLAKELEELRHDDVDADARVESLELRIGQCRDNITATLSEKESETAEYSKCRTETSLLAVELETLGDKNVAHGKHVEALDEEIRILLADIQQCDDSKLEHDQCAESLATLEAQPWCQEPAAPAPGIVEVFSGTDDAEGCDETLYGANGVGYKGCQDHARNGMRCQAWSSQTPHGHWLTDADFDGETMDAASNFCRNPDHDDTIWCYVDDENTRWEFCDPLPVDYFCASEDEQCDCVGGDVVYGRKFDGESEMTFESLIASGDFVLAVSSGSTMCSNDGVGGDPAPGETKQCFCTPHGEVASPLPLATPEPHNCYQLADDLGVSYRGKQDKTVSGKICQAWTAQSPQSHTWYNVDENFNGETVLEAGNYCRNPSGHNEEVSHDTIWCYTTDADTRWEECEPLCDDFDPVPTPTPEPVLDATDVDCDETLAGENGVEYKGCQTKTRGGHECQAWTAQAPHDHHFTTADFTGETIEAAGNKCRNPDNDETIWCYTTDPNQVWEFCDPVAPAVVTPAADPTPQPEQNTEPTDYSEPAEPEPTPAPAPVVTPPAAAEEHGCDETLEGDGAGYKGCQTMTVNGNTCQRWDSNSPHGHSRGFHGPYSDYWEGLGEDADAAGNYCRNPDGEPSIWCYTTNPDVRWELCEPVQGGEAPDPTPEPTPEPAPHVTPPAALEEHGCDETLEGDGAGYVGCQTVTRSGKTCQRWDTLSPHSHSRGFSGYYKSYWDGLGEDAESASNYCRNPDGEPSIWCYTDDPNSRWEFCDPVADSSDVPEPAAEDYTAEPEPEATPAPVPEVTPPAAAEEHGCDETLEGDGAGYKGCQTMTVGGNTCQRWDSDSPHGHSRGFHGPYQSYWEGLGEDADAAGNYCRNPDGEPSIWCYTTNPDVRWELCEPVQGGEAPDPTPEPTPAPAPAVTPPPALEEHGCDETLEGDGAGYVGCQTVTRSGKTCQRWDTLSPHSHSRGFSGYYKSYWDGLGEDAESAGNYCRNPDGEPSIWCYTDDPNSRWEYCDPVAEEASATPEPTPAADDYVEQGTPMPTPAPTPGASGCDETLVDDGYSYKGCQTKTRSGIECQAWSSQSPHEHHQSDSDFDGETMEQAGNYCRNPDHDDTIWCYTTDDNTRWEFCEPVSDDEETDAAFGAACALENETCECPGGDFIYGRRYEEDSSDSTFDSVVSSGNYILKPHEEGVDAIECGNDEMGGDPVEGEPKQCYCAVAGSVPSTSNEDEVFETPASSDCDETLAGDDGYEYKGCQTRTRSGYQCQPWVSHYPHVHHFSDSDFYEETMEEAGNKCRNPDHDDTIWCYTTDPDQRWEFCDPA